MTRARLALCVGLAAAGAMAGWALRTAGTPRDDVDALEHHLAAARAEREQAEAALTHARQRARGAEHDEARARQEAGARETPAPLATPPDADATAPAPEDWRSRVAAYPAFPFENAGPEVRDALAGVDWVTVAESMSAMIPVADTIAGTLAHGETPTAESIGASQERNGPLLTVAMRLHANGVPGTGANGAFTHPAFMTNAIVATLDALGLPVDSAQLERLGAVGVDFVSRERARAAAGDDDACALRTLIAEVELKRDFLAAAFAVLTPEQRAALRPAAVRGRIAADLFSEGLVWTGRAWPLPHRDDAHLAELLATRLLGDADPAVRERALALVAAWVAGLPEAVRGRAADPLDRVGMIDAAHATECARHLLSLVTELLRDADLDDASTKRLRELDVVTVPFRTASD